jgi:hypothetical protein
MNSCRMRRPASLCSMDLYGLRSLPQMAARVTDDEGVRGLDEAGVGTGSTRTSPAPMRSAARRASPEGLPFETWTECAQGSIGQP